MTETIRDEITALVLSIQPYDGLERDHIDATLEWIASSADLVRIKRPDIPPQHLVSYCMLVDPIARRLLLVDHRISGLWLPSGGHVEPDEHPDVTAVREMREELGIDADLLFPEPFFLTVTQTTGTVARHTDVSLWYLFQGNSSLVLDSDSGEFHGVRWFAFDEIPFERGDPHLQRFVTKLEACMNHTEQI